MRDGKSNDEVEDFIKNLEWSVLISQIPDTEKLEKLEKGIAKLQYELDMYDPQRAIQRVLGRKK